MRKTFATGCLAIALCASAMAAPASNPGQQTPVSSPAFEQAVDKVIAREAENLKALRGYRPVVETYIQTMAPDIELGSIPAKDDYFIGRVSFTEKEVSDASMIKEQPGRLTRTLGSLRRITGLTHMEYLPEGFASMVIIDGTNFDRAHYSFDFVGREFLGDLRCAVIDVAPKKGSGKGRFAGRIWVEDQEFNIVRFNGTYVPQARNGRYLHFDTWRLNLQPGMWLPAYVYSEESNLKTGAFKAAAYKSQTRLWGFNTGKVNKTDEFSEILVDSNDAVKDHSDTIQDLSPVNSQRTWERQAEDNVMERMERAGVLARRGEVDKVLMTVLNNLVVTNNVDVQPELRARVLLTSPVETFSIGHTVVVSRGLLDVLPDEASLASVLAHELAHIALGHRIDTKYSFSDRMFFPDESTFNRLQFHRNEQEEAAADKKAVEFLQNSPYKDKLTSVGLFLRQLQNRQEALPNLIRARMGNPLLLGTQQVRMNDLMVQAPKLEPKKLDQIAALPLGGRIKVDPWSNTITMSKNKPVALVTPNEKMPLEVTPMFPYLTRLNAEDKSTAGQTTPAATSSESTPASAPVSQQDDGSKVAPADGATKVAQKSGDSQ